MFRSILALGLLANGLLFAAGIWRSVMWREQAFHDLGDIADISGWLSHIWLWPLTLILICLLLVATAKQNHQMDEYDD